MWAQGCCDRLQGGKRSIIHCMTTTSNTRERQRRKQMRKKALRWYEFLYVTAILTTWIQVEKETESEPGREKNMDWEAGSVKMEQMTGKNGLGRWTVKREWKEPGGGDERRTDPLPLTHTPCVFKRICFKVGNAWKWRVHTGKQNTSVNVKCERGSYTCTRRHTAVSTVCYTCQSYLTCVSLRVWNNFL